MNPKTRFHIHKSEDLKSKERDPKDSARLESRWGKRGQKEDDFLKARDGDSLMVPFECDLCIFRKLRRENPKAQSPSDQLLLLCIRRMNLDAFWSSASSTVRANKNKVNQML